MNFLLEIGTEEIPDWMIRQAFVHLGTLLKQVLIEDELGGNIDNVDGTPRRLMVRAEGLVERTPDKEEVILGPPKTAHSGATSGFAKKMGVTVADLQVISTPRGEYLAARRKAPGRPARDILAERLPELILNISFPKTMYWTHKDGPHFIRPIRWLVALLGDEVVPFELAGVKSGNETSGHRRLGSARIPVTVDNYIEKLRENYVIVSSDERRRKIQTEGPGDLDPDLLETLVYITEYPTPIQGNFDPQFLSLPEEVLVTVMRHHQKYFSVREESGKLAPKFIAVMNTKSDPEGLVRAGNERVLRARFNDARFFWDFDQRKPLIDRVDDLDHVTFQKDLGSYLKKTRQVVELVKQLGGNEHAQRSALLSKCDLTTEMVKEFTELQGIVGGLYARAQGEPEPVAQAIYDHYKPVSMEDSIPSSDEGRLLALADKLDTLRGCFRIGLIPSGSRDPFALRRAAQGVVKILVEGRISLPLSQLADADAQLVEFLLDRVKYYFKEVRGFKYDEVNAALAAGYDDLPDVERRLEALQAVRPTENFEPLAASFKRIRNILLQAQFGDGGSIDTARLEAGPESDLHGEFARLRPEVAAHRANRDYRRALELIASMRPRVDLFFDKVLVNAPDAAIRHNRLSLLASLLTEFSSIADFSEIITSSQS
jgi:glycyl-tRNA synthetase beta chain